jgi:hypothetical protein
MYMTLVVLIQHCYVFLALLIIMSDAETSEETPTQCYAL